MNSASPSPSNSALPPSGGAASVPPGDAAGGPAFPSAKGVMVQHLPDGKVSTAEVWPVNEGMSLRDWFAGMALQGWIANPTDKAGANVAAICYQIADAMISERNKQP